MAIKKQPKGKATRNTTKTIAKGRPTKYLPAYAEQARKLALLGLSDAKMADFWGVTEQTVNNWKRDHPSFFECLREGKEAADASVALSLYRTALGGAVVKEVREEPDSEGGIIRKTVTREVPADVRAQKYWLACRQPDKWRESLQVADVTPPEKLAETAVRFESIMAEARARNRTILIERGILSGDGEA